MFDILSLQLRVGKPMNQDEILRYSRHFSLPNVGSQGQLKLKNAKVLCIGAGGLGSPLLLYLAAAGIGTLGIVDNDTVDVSNLQRQVLYTTADVGQKKVSAAKARLQALNPHINITRHDARLTADNALELINQYDIVADGTDNFATRYLVNDACWHLKKPNVYASIFQFEGQCSIFSAPNGPCYRCLYDAPPPAGLVPNCAEGGVFGILPGLLGSLQATEVLKLILGIGDPLIGRLLTVDSLTMRFREFAVQRNPGCRLCTHQQSFASLPNHDMEVCQVGSLPATSISVQELAILLKNNTDLLLLDVRESHEYDICNLAGKSIPLGQLSQRLHELDKSSAIVIHCKSGARSAQACLLLEKAGFKNVRNLDGGILAWAKHVDPSVPTY